MKEAIISISHFLFILSIGFYLITCLQWFSYRFERILFHFTKPLWHIWFFIVPYFVFLIFTLIEQKFLYIFYAYFYVIYLPTLYFWNKKLDKKLVFTPRVKRFFLILALVTIFINAIMIFKVKMLNLSIILPLTISFIISFACEKYNQILFKKSALNKISKMKNLTIIQITASYGKTSIKNFLYQILSEEFKCYKTPRSVNTLNGLISDINNNLTDDIQIYITEAGARLSGDILKITNFLNPQIVVVGEIGPQHIEYFKTVENIRNTKLEALKSSRLKHAFLHSSTNLKENENITIYNNDMIDMQANLDGIKFSTIINNRYKSFSSKILGKFNIENIACCVKIADFLGLDEDIIEKRVSKISSVEHRLQKIDNKEKFIIDDSFNGNLKGMLLSYDLVGSYKGRKIIVTPGIVESTKEDNETLAKKINQIFDFVIVTGELNSKIFENTIDKNKIFILKNKSKLTQTLSTHTQKGDLVLFSNDAPNFI